MNLQYYYSSTYENKNCVKDTIYSNDSLIKIESEKFPKLASSESVL